MHSLQIPGLPKSFSRIGLGCMHLSPEREADSFALLDTYLALGGNLFDTAEVYGQGNSELALGEYLRRRGSRADVVIVTKGCVEPYLVRPDYIRGAISRSLERLRTDVIDVYLLHRDDPAVPAAELVDVLNEAVSAGQVRVFGGSNWTTARLAEANRAAAAKGVSGFVVSSPHLGLATPRQAWWDGCTHATRDDLQWYAEQKLVVLGWSTQCRGFFAKETTTDPAYLAELIRVYYSAANLEKRQRLHALAARRGATSGQLAVAYVLSLDAPTAALVGATTIDDLRTLMAAEQFMLSARERAWLQLESASCEP
jgi:aryl-alcohol dehydrogenase-like predicted oxidoreductase